MEQEFVQHGGIRYGESFYRGANFTWPFACLRVTGDSLVLKLSFLHLSSRTFAFPKSEIRALRWKRGLFSIGLHIEHAVSSYPPFILFWTLDRKKLAESLKNFGYELSEKS
jgi:hypothetical protein